MTLLWIGISLFTLGSVLSVIVSPKQKDKQFFFFAALAQFFIIPFALQIMISGQEVSSSFNLSAPIGRVLIQVDPLSAFFLLFISFGSALAALYSMGYLKMYEGDRRYSNGSYYFFMGLLSVSMMAVTIVENAMMFLIVWEIMSLSSFFLVTYENHKEDVRQAGLYYFIAMQIGAAFLLVAFGWASWLTGDMSIAAFSQISVRYPGIAALIFLLFFIGFGTKAGFIPLHSWLPQAHPAAPTGVSAVMSGIMIKTGIYGILRIILVMGVPATWLAYFVFAVGLVAGILGVMNAIAQHDLKRLLAYHSIENIGIIGLGIGLGMIGSATGHPFIALAGYLGAILHVFNHFTFKSLLFYGAGVIYTKTHTRDIEKLGGLIHVMPYTAALFLLASLAISGLPLFNGFVSEFALYYGMARGLATNGLSINLAAIIGMSGLAFIGIMAVICFTKVFGICFQGTSRGAMCLEPNKESPLMLIPMFVLAALIVFIGLAAPLILPLLSKVIGQFVPDVSYWNSMMDIYDQLSRGLWLFGGLILVTGFLRWLLLRKRTIRLDKTWGCGYQTESSRSQYTASSFASSFLGLVSEFVPVHQKLERPQGLFPTSASYSSHGDDLLDRWLIRPLLQSVQWFLKLFSWIQSGHMQQYIMYGLIFLVILLIWTMGVR